MKLKTRYNLYIITWILLIILWIIYNILFQVNIIINIIFYVAGFSFILISTLKYNKHWTWIIKDERTLKLSLVSTSYSWFITFVSINIIFWLNYLKIINFTKECIISIIMFIMIMSLGILQLFFKKKSDYEN